MNMTRRGFLGGAAAASAGAFLLPGSGQAMAQEKSTVYDMAGHLARVCAPQIDAIREHPWIRAASRDQLKDIQIGSWATQDLLWGDWIGPAYTTGFAGAPPAAQAALSYLKGNDAAETAYLESTSKNFRNAPGASQIWPGFLGYGAYGALTGEREQAQAAPHKQSLTVVWAAEYAYNQAWKAVAAGRPSQEWAKFGARNWGGPGFSGGVAANLSAGLNAAAAASPVPAGTLEEVARQVFLWEFRAWTDAYECTGWNLARQAARA